MLPRPICCNVLQHFGGGVAFARLAWLARRFWHY